MYITCHLYCCQVIVHKSCTACLSYFIVHCPCTRDAPTYTKREWLVYRILSFTLRAYATLRRIQNLNGLTIVFYRSHSAHTRRSDVYIDYRQVWVSLRLAPITMGLAKNIVSDNLPSFSYVCFCFLYLYVNLQSLNVLYVLWQKHIRI